jgi:hypothetical protein
MEVTQALNTLNLTHAKASIEFIFDRGDEAKMVE